MASIEQIGEFSEQGRGLPVQASRPGAALPASPLVKAAFAPTPRARLGWGQGVIAVRDIPLEPARSVRAGDGLAQVAALMRTDDSDFVPVVSDEGRFLGVVYVEELLRCVADNQGSPDLKKLISTQIPTCAPHSALVDAVRLMITCFLRRIPVVGDAGELTGMLTLSTAATYDLRDPSVADVLEQAACSPGLWARRWR